MKIYHIGQAGGEIGIIGLVAPGDPFGGSFGGDTPLPDIPGYMISQADADVIRSGLDEGVIARFDPSVGIPLIGHMVGSSSRGPSMLTNLIKPEIGAPGASVSAIAGSGTGEEPFSGTSGATPMVSGSAALVMDAFPGRSWLEVKAVLMNTAETDIINNAALDGGDLAPISRIGAGEVRVNRAVASPAAAWDSDSPTGALSFGFHDVYRGRVILKRQVIVRNYTDQGLHYDIRHTFRYENDAGNGAVTLSMPARVFVPANGDARFWVIMHIDGRQLREWSLNSGSLGADPAPLTELEYDGYIWLDDMATDEDDEDPLHLPWHVLPRQAGNVRVTDETVAIDGSYQGIPAGDTRVRNQGVGDAPVESYSLLATSDDLPEGGPGGQNPTPDFRYFGYATFPVPADFCSENESFVLAFAINTWERQTHANAPASLWINLDVDQDPTTGGGPSGAEYTVLRR